MPESESGASSALSRHRKMACSSCRSRKSKCDGATPSCSTCSMNKLKCHYEKLPSIAYVRSLQERIKKLEGELQQSQSSPIPNTAGPINTGSTDDEASISIDAHGAVSYHTSTSAIHEVPFEKGSPYSSLALTDADVESVERQNAEVRRSLVANAATQRRWEELSLEMASAHTDIPKALASALLKLHWCWLHPSFMFVYRPAFTRDMLLLGGDNQSTAYFSNTLLKVLYAHSCRFIRTPVTFWYQQDPGASGPTQPFYISRELTDRLMLEAHISLAMETLNPPSIPTIQALLQQSARDVACGRSSQAWLYSGMAFRMAIDLGIHLPPDKLQSYVKSLSPEDIEIRKRLFWSLFAWDKHISLYLGKMPNFLAGTESVPLHFLDDFTETDFWQPYYGPDDLPKDIESESPYPPTTGHVISCFTELCKLCKILSSLMLDLYSPQPVRRPQEKPDDTDPKAIAFQTISSGLRAWWSALPSFLRILPSKTPHLCRPAHITSLNLMYHCTLILLHRPYIINRRVFESGGVQRSFSICKSATTAIHDLLQMYVKTFGFQHITYMNSYCTYTAATVAVFQLEQAEKQDLGPFTSAASSVQAELKFLLEILQNTAPSMPGLHRSIGILKDKVKEMFDRRANTQFESLFFGNQTQQNRPQQPLSFDPLCHFPSNPATATVGTDMPRFPSTAATPYTQQTNSHTNSTSTDNGGGGWADSLTAFPGQDVFLGPDPVTLDQERLSPDARFALMGFNLDPHLSLDHPAGIEGMNGFGTIDE